MGRGLLGVSVRFDRLVLCLLCWLAQPARCFVFRNGSLSGDGAFVFFGSLDGSGAFSFFGSLQHHGAVGTSGSLRSLGAV
jgi:hypothetical protein